MRIIMLRLWRKDTLLFLLLLFMLGIIQQQQQHVKYLVSALDEPVQQLQQQQQQQQQQQRNKDSSQSTTTTTTTTCMARNNDDNTSTNDTEEGTCQVVEMADEKNKENDSVTTTTSAAAAAIDNNDTESEMNNQDVDDNADDIDSDEEEDDDNDEGCQDYHQDCPYWAVVGECMINPVFMMDSCPKSCEICHDEQQQQHYMDDDGFDGEKDEKNKNNDEFSICQDKHDNCYKWAEPIKGCFENRQFMYQNCRKSCLLCSDDYTTQEMLRGADIGVPQVHETNGYEVDPKKVMERIRRARRYIQTGDFTDDEIQLCKNKDELCAAFAVDGECKYNPLFMKKDCAPVCFSCDQLTVERRCKVDPATMPDIWKPGDLNAMFERITSKSAKESYLSNYDIHILSSPYTNYYNQQNNNNKDDNNNDDDDNDDNNDYDKKLYMNQGDPWVIIMENVVTPEEAKHLIDMGESLGFERSGDVGERNLDGTYQKDVNRGRTSTNTWCTHECFDHELTQSIMDRLTNITGIPRINSEYLQLLKYEPGQFYRGHHDFIPYQVNRPPGGRILTLLLYLNDVVEGGATRFPELNLTVYPKTGRALIWPNVIDSNPNERDLRTSHKALPVRKGIKYAANAWYHLRDWKTAKPPGGRILTLLLYLNDVVEGGATRFPELNLTVYPKTGRALIWPNVIDSNPNERDLRTSHKALPVRKGIKYAANAWYHLRDWKTAKPPGGRILTLLLYLNDVVEGGATRFPELNLTVYPKTGRALIWPNVIDSNPNERDLRTSHKALPVRKGIKYAANAWYHLRDWKTAKYNKCT